MLRSPPPYYKIVTEAPDDNKFDTIDKMVMRARERKSAPIPNESYSITESLRVGLHEKTQEEEIREIESIEKSLEAIQIFLDENPKIAKSVQVVSLFEKARN